MGYLAATRHPWCSFLFLLPLIVLYEGGVFWLAGSEPQEAFRNGADVWLRKALESYGVRPVLSAPGLVLGILILWSFLRWGDRPQRPFVVILGMALESVVLGVVLQSISVNFPAILKRSGLDLLPSAIDLNLTQDRMAKIVTFVGAGIYEEVLFRFLLFGVGSFVLRIAFVPSLFALPLAAILSSLLFAGAHHVGEHGEPFERTTFMLRVAQGMFFCLIYWLRGFGVAVGTHAAYDIIVGVKWT